MKEFEKDELTAEAEENNLPTDSEVQQNEQEPVNEAEQEQGSDLEQELEDIRDMFQQELDAAQKESEEEDAREAENESGIVIQELDEIVEQEDDEVSDSDEPLCECCDENPCSKEHGEGYPYCDGCRELMKKYPLRASGIFAALIMAVVLCASVYLGSTYLEDVYTIVDASSYYNSGYTMSAMQSYYTYFNGGMQGSKPSMRAVKEVIDCYKRTGYYSDAASMINTYFSESALKLPWNKKYSDLIEESEALTESYYAVTEVAEPALSGLDFDYDEIIAGLDELKQAKPLEEGTGNVEAYNEVFIEYYKYVVMSIHGEPVEAQLEQLKTIDAIGEGYEWAYLANLCALAAMTGDKELTDDAFDRLIKNNRQDTNAYIAKASYYRYLEQPDADAIIEICDEAASVAYSSDVSYQQYYAIAYLLKGEGSLALEAIEAFMNSGSYTVQSCNLYALCGLYCGDTDIYEEMADLLASYGYSISEVVTKYKNDEITILEALQDMGGDI